MQGHEEPFAYDLPPVPAEQQHNVAFHAFSPKVPHKANPIRSGSGSGGGGIHSFRCVGLVSNSENHFCAEDVIGTKCSPRVMLSSGDVHVETSQSRAFSRGMLGEMSAVWWMR